MTKPNKLYLKRPSQIPDLTHVVLYLHGVVGSGKTVLAANLINQGYSIVDTDFIAFEWFLNETKISHLKTAFVPPPWKQRGKDRLIWNLYTDTCLCIAWALAKETSSVLITNIVSDVFPKKVGYSITFAPSPDELVRRVIKRNEGDSKELISLGTAKSWIDGWKKNNDRYDLAFQLGDGQYLTDFFDIDVQITDAKICNKIVRDHMVSILERPSSLTDLFLYLP